MSLEARPLTLRAAAAYINTLHRHHVAPRGWKFGIAAYEGEKMVGVVTVGRPVARGNDDGFTAEVNRLCMDGTKNAPSFLYAAAWRAARAMGYRRLITYILAEEPGTTLKAAGWRLVGSIKGKSWDTPSRARTDKHPTTDKLLFEIAKDPTAPASAEGECPHGCEDGTIYKSKFAGVDGESFDEYPCPIHAPAHAEAPLCECGHKKVSHGWRDFVGCCAADTMGRACPCTAYRPATGKATKGGE